LKYFTENYLPTPEEAAEYEARESQSSTASTRNPLRMRRCYESEPDSGDETPSPTTSSAIIRQRQLEYARLYITSAHIKKPETSGMPEEPSIDDPHGPSQLFFRGDPLEYWKKEEAKQNLDAAPLTAMARDVFSVIPHSTGVESSFSVARMAVSWQQARMGPEHLREYMLVRQKLRQDVPIKHQARQRLESVAASRDFTNYVKEVEKSAEIRRRKRQQRRIPLDSLSQSKGFISDAEDELDHDPDRWDTFDDDGKSCIASYLIAHNGLPETSSIFKPTITYGDLFRRMKSSATMINTATSEDSDMDFDDSSSDEEDELAAQAAFIDASEEEDDMNDSADSVDSDDNVCTEPSVDELEEVMLADKTSKFHTLPTSMNFGRNSEAIRHCRVTRASTKSSLSQDINLIGDNTHLDEDEDPVSSRRMNTRSLGTRSQKAPEENNTRGPKRRRVAS